MSFLAGRLASTEGAYFLQESKQAVTRIIEKTKPKLPSSSSSSSSSNAIQNEAASSSADVLPEVLKHSLPPKIFQSSSTPNSSSFSTTSKWVLQTDPNKPTFVSSDALNPLRAYASLPQVTFGPKRYYFSLQLSFTSLGFLFLADSPKFGRERRIKEHVPLYECLCLKLTVEPGKVVVSRYIFWAEEKVLLGMRLLELLCVEAIGEKNKIRSLDFVFS